MERKNDFDEELIATIDKVLTKCFGQSSPLIYAWLRIHSINPEEIPEKLDVFADALKTFSAGGSVVVTIIVRNLCAKFGLNYDPTNVNCNFADRITELRIHSQASIFSSVREE